MIAIQVFEGDGIAPPHPLSLAEAKSLRRGARLFHAVSRGTYYIIAAIEDEYDSHGRVKKVKIWVNVHGDGSMVYVVPGDTWLCKDEPQ